MGGGASLTRFTALPESIDRTLFFKLTDEYFLEQDKRRSNKMSIDFVPDFDIKTNRYRRGFSEESFRIFCDRAHGLISSQRLLDIMASSDCYCSYDIGYDSLHRSTRKRVEEVMNGLVQHHQIIISTYEGSHFNQLTNKPIIDLREKITQQQKNASCLVIFLTKKYCEQVNYSSDILSKKNSPSSDLSSSSSISNSSSTFHTNENNMTHQLFVELDQFLKLHGEYKVLSVLLETTAITPDMGLLYKLFKDHPFVDLSHDFKENPELFDKKLKSLSQNIQNIVKLLKDGGNFLIKNIHQSNTTEGKLVTWLQTTVEPRIDPLLTEKYGKIMKDNGIENIFKLAHSIKFNDSLLVEIGIPKVHSDLIKTFINKDLSESLDTKKLAVVDNYFRKKKELEKNVRGVRDTSTSNQSSELRVNNSDPNQEVDSELLKLIETENARSLIIKNDGKVVQSFVDESNYLFENSCMKKEDELSKNFNATFALSSYIESNNKKKVLYNTNIDNMMKKNIVMINKYNRKNILSILSKIKNEKLSNIKTIIESYNSVLECSNYFIYLYEQLLASIRKKEDDDDVSDSDSDSEGSEEEEEEDEDDEIEEEDETNFFIEEEESKSSKSSKSSKDINTQSRPVSRERDRNVLFSIRSSTTPIPKKLAKKIPKLNSTSVPKELVVNNLITSSFVNINSSKQNKPSAVSKTSRFFENILPYSESIGHKAVELSPQIPKRKKKFMLILYEIGLLLRKIEFFCYNSVYHCKEFAACNVIKLLLTMLTRIYPYHLVFLLPETVEVNDVLKKYYHKIEFPNQFFLTLSMILSPGLSNSYIQTDQILLLNRYGVLKVSTDLLKFYFLNIKVLCKILQLIVINISNKNNLLRKKLVKNLVNNRNFFMILKLIFDKYCCKNSKSISEIDFYISYIYSQCAMYYGTSTYRQNLVQIPILYISKQINNMIIFLGAKDSSTKINTTDFNLWYPNNEKLLYNFLCTLEKIFYYPVREFSPHHDLSVNQVSKEKKIFKFMTRDLKVQLSEYNLMEFLFNQLETFFSSDFNYNVKEDINLEDSRYISSQLLLSAERFCLNLINSTGLFPAEFYESSDGIPTGSSQNNSDSTKEVADSLHIRLKISMILKIFDVIINSVYLRNDLKLLYLKYNRNYLIVVIFFYFQVGLYLCKKVPSYCSLAMQILSKCCLVLSNLLLILEEDEEEFPANSFVRKIIDEYHLIELLMDVWAFSRGSSEFQNAFLILIDKLIQNTNFFCTNHLVLVGFLEKFLFYISSNKNNTLKYNKIELLYSILNKFLNYNRRNKDLRLNSDQRIINSKSFIFESFASQYMSDFCLNSIYGPHWSHFSPSSIIYTQYNEANSPEAHANIFTMDIDDEDFSSLVKDNEESNMNSLSQPNSLLQTSLELQSQPSSKPANQYSNPYSKSYMKSKSKNFPNENSTDLSESEPQLSTSLYQASSITFNPSIDSTTSLTKDKYLCKNSSAFSNICRSCLMISNHLSLIYSASCNSPVILKRIHDTKLPFLLKNAPKVFNTENELIVNDTIISIRERFLDEGKKDTPKEESEPENEKKPLQIENSYTKKKKIFLLPAIPLYFFHSDEEREDLALFPNLNIELVYNVDYESFYTNIEQLIDALNL